MNVDHMWLAAEIARVRAMLPGISKGDWSTGRSPVGWDYKTDHGSIWGHATGPQHYAVRESDEVAKRAMFDQIERDSAFIGAIQAIAPAVLDLALEALSRTKPG